jgi:hypothetical protein
VNDFQAEHGAAKDLQIQYCGIGRRDHEWWVGKDMEGKVVAYLNLLLQMVP